jgi:N-acetylmuramoyl-L-alanine amidase
MNVPISKKYLVYSSERRLKGVRALTIHYTANAGTTAKQNIDYLRKTRNGLLYHFIIDLDGTIYQTQELGKRAIHCGSRKYKPEATKFFGEHDAPSYFHTAEHQHTGSPNNWTIGICFCHEDETGKPSDKQYESLVCLLAELCSMYKLSYKGGIWRHYDVTGKVCPKYYVDNQDEFVRLLHDVGNGVWKIERFRDNTPKE